MRRRAKEKQIVLEKGAPTPERIKELWGIARKRVYFAIKLVERQNIFKYFYENNFTRVTQDRDSKHREVLHGFERQNNVESMSKFPKIK